MEEKSEQDTQFHSSELGTQEYWDEVYRRELDVFKDTGIVGDNWYGEDSQERMVGWVTEKSGLPLSTRIIDLGCGNGKMLFTLREEGFTSLTGVDYSKFSIELCHRIAKQENATDLKFQVFDILSETEAGSYEGHYDLCLDKGTYDAISLKHSCDPTSRTSYVQNVHSILSKGGILLIASCNWSRLELEKDFAKDFEVVNDLPAPSFTFGGQTGQTVTTLVMRKRD